MAFDAHKNLAGSTVAVAPSPPTSGGSVSVAAGEGARFPAAPFNATVWPSGLTPTPANAEIVRVTAVAGDALTITRAQEGTTARAIGVGDLLAATVTVKALTDLESGTNFPLITTPGSGTFGSDVLFTANAGVRQLNNNTFVNFGHGAGAFIRAHGDTVSGGNAGLLQLTMGTVAGSAIDLASSATGIVQRIHRSGGVSFGSATDPGAGNVSVASNLLEKGRTTPIGHWTVFTPTLGVASGTGTWTAVNAYASYMRVGLTCFIRCQIEQGTLAGGPAVSLRISGLPFAVIGINNASPTTIVGDGYLGSGHELLVFEAPHAATWVDITRTANQNFPASVSNTYVRCQFCYETAG